MAEPAKKKDSPKSNKPRVFYDAGGGKMTEKAPIKKETSES